MKVQDLVRALLLVSKKAANLARRVRSNETLFQLLVEEKTGEAKNKRFVQDFKTLADVLVQETVKHDLGEKFPGLVGHIFGEEDNTFTNALGESVVVEVKASIEETAELLATVLEGNRGAANLLATVVHQQPEHADVCSKNFDLLEDLEISANDTAIWIDPIDSTTQYISGTKGVQGPQGVFREGLPCVLVLIGAYDKRAGQPIAGVINQPFCQLDSSTKQWTGRTLWGVSCAGVKVNSLSPPPHQQQQPEDGASSTRHPIVISTSEDKDIQAKLKNHDSYEPVFAAGAGYKILCAIDKLAMAYLLSHGSTYKWDTCGPHAILCSMSGGIVDFQQAFDLVKQHREQDVTVLGNLLKECQLVYDRPDSTGLKAGEKWQNAHGIIAYTSLSDLVDLLKALLNE